MKWVKSKVIPALFAGLLVLGFSPMAAQADSTVTQETVFDTVSMQQNQVTAQQLGGDKLAHYASGLEGAQMMHAREMSNVRGEAWWIVPVYYCARYCKPAIEAVWWSSFFW